MSVVKTKPKLSLQKPADRQSNESIRLEFIKDRAEAKRDKEVLLKEKVLEDF